MGRRNLSHASGAYQNTTRVEARRDGRHESGCASRSSCGQTIAGAVGQREPCRLSEPGSRSTGVLLRGSTTSPYGLVSLECPDLRLGGNSVEANLEVAPGGVRGVQHAVGVDGGGEES